MASLNTVEFEQSPVAQVVRQGMHTNTRLTRLIRLARTGDRSSFDQLVDSYREGLKAFLSHRVEDSEVEDVIQDVFVAAWRALPSYDGRSQFRTWLFAIAFNKVRDHYRQRVRRVPEVHIPTDEPGIPCQRDDYAATDLSMAVRQLLRHLSESQSEVVLLYYQDQLTLAEIATVLQRNLSTVKYQFFQAHAKLADHVRKSPEWSAMIAPHTREGTKRA